MCFFNGVMGIAFPPGFGILSGFTRLTVHVVPKVPGNAVYVPVGGNMFCCVYGDTVVVPWGENVFIVYIVYT